MSKEEEFVNEVYRACDCCIP